MPTYRVVNTYVDRDGKRRSPGETVELSQERAAALIKRRLLAASGGTGPVETAARRPPETATKQTAGPVHVGGGVYELPSGERVRGKDEAEKRMQA